MSSRTTARTALEALGDGHRRAIVELLERRPQSVQELADQLPISRPAVSRHLRLLKEASLVSDRVDGTRRIYSLDAAGLAVIRTYVERLWSVAERRFQLLAENTPPRSRARHD